VWKDAERDVGDRMMAERLVFECADDIWTAHPEWLKDGGWGRNEAADLWGWAVALLERAVDWNKSTKITANLHNDIYVHSRSNWSELFQLRLGRFRTTVKTADGRSSFKRSVLIDHARYPDPAQAIAAKLGQTVEWLGFDDEPEPSQPKSRGRPGNSDSPKAQYMRERRAARNTGPKPA
jgi:hypothetical protein